MKQQRLEGEYGWQLCVVGGGFQKRPRRVLDVIVEVCVVVKHWGDVFLRRMMHRVR